MLKKTKAKIIEVLKEKEVEEEIKEAVVDLQNPGFDPDLPENKQRWLR